MNRKIDAATPPSLLLRIRDHRDTESWEAFVEVYSPLIYEFTRQRGIQATDAADITQEVLLRVARAIRRFEYDRDKGLFRDWLARIVLNELRRHYGKNGKTDAAENLDQLDGQVEAEWNDRFHQHLFAVALERCRSQFTEETWQLFEQSWIKKLPANEVAEHAGVRIDRVYVARSRVLKRLRYEVAILADDMA